jgi:hypothetical protein
MFDNVRAEVVTSTVFVPEMLILRVSVPEPPLSTSPAFSVVPLAVRPSVPIVATYVSFVAPPVSVVSAPVVSDQVGSKGIV